MGDFLVIQTQTGWGQTLRTFAEWCRPAVGWLALDVGCGPGLLPALLAEMGCRAYGLDVDAAALASPLHPSLACADALDLPFPAGTFDLITASNVLFLLAEPQAAVHEIGRVLRRGGQLAVLNPSERLTVELAQAVADRRGLQGAARQSLLTWAGRAEAHRRWNETDLAALFAAAGLVLAETELKVGPGMARFARAAKEA